MVTHRLRYRLAAEAEGKPDRLGDANDLADPGLGRLERQREPLHDLAPEHGLVDQAGGAAVTVDVG
jgi:hypothetical protein